MPLGKQVENAIPIGSGDRSLLVFIEKVRPDRRYFRQMGQLGIYYRFATQEQPAETRWVDDLMRELLDELQRLVDRAPEISARAAIAQLRRARAAS
jgi:class 3 adenylate cyclase